MSSDILGIRVDRLSTKMLHELCVEWLNDDSPHQLHRVVTVNPEFVMEAQTNSEFREVLNTASAALADGIGLLFASLILHGWGRRLYRVTGVDFTWMLADMCEGTGARMYIMGAGRGVAEKAAAVLMKAYPTLCIVGAEMGIPPLVTKTSDLFDRELCEKIVASAPDVLLVAFGAPRQDMWIARNAHRLTGVKIAVGVGGALDYLAGIVPYAPRWVRSIGFEWTYRLMTQPHRVGRIATAVIRFPLAVLLSKVRRTRATNI